MGKEKKEFATIKAVCNSELHEKFKEKCRKKDIQMNTQSPYRSNTKAFLKHSTKLNEVLKA